MSLHVAVDALKRHSWRQAAILAGWTVPELLNLLSEAADDIRLALQLVAASPEETSRLQRVEAHVQSALAVLEALPRFPASPPDVLSISALEQSGRLASDVIPSLPSLLTRLTNSLLVSMVHFEGRYVIYDCLAAACQRVMQVCTLASDWQIVATAPSEGQQLDEANVALSVASLLRPIRTCLRSRILDHVQLTVEIEPRLAPFSGDIVALRYAMTALIVNALEALFETGGNIFVQARSCPSELVYQPLGLLQPGTWQVTTAAPSQHPANDYLRLSVTDSGSGVPDNACEELFDVRFSTRAEDRGIGLAIVRDIVQTQGGVVRVTSTPGRGTSASVFLPCKEMSIRRYKANGNGLRQVEQPSDTAVSSILVIDDELFICESARETLQVAGWEVYATVNGREGLWRYRQNPTNLVLLDMNMPNMNGEEIFRRLKEIDPQANIVIATGCPKAEVSRRLSGRKDYQLLPKPYSADALLGAVETALVGKRVA